MSKRPQKPIQPGVTPPRPGKEHCMVLNRTGQVRHTLNKAGKAFAFVEWTETGRRPIFMIRNRQGYTRAALSYEAVVLFGGSPGVLCRPLGWSGDITKADWSAPIPKVQGVALGTGWVAVACKPRLLRLFTVSGLQLAVWCSPGPHVVAVGHGKQLAIYYHTAAPGPDGRQAISVQRYLAVTRAAAPGAPLGTPLPLSLRPGASVTWAGFSDQGSLCWADSLGRVHLLANGSVWEVVCDLPAPRESFIAGVLESTQTICVASCCAEASYPEPGAPLCLVPFRLPFLRCPASQHEVEHAMASRRVEALLRERCDGQRTCRARQGYAIACQNRDKLLLQRFESALKRRQVLVAAELASQMRSPSLAKQAAAIAGQQHLPSLVEWIGKLPTAERLRCSCQPEVVIRPLSMAELKRRRAAKRQNSQYSTLSRPEAARPPIECSNPFEVVLKRQRIECEGHRLGEGREHGSGSRPHASSRQLTLPEMMRKAAGGRKRSSE
ncbi:WD repeat and HMG-box DNA-binding protein 1-like [Dermacentor silvarum]|uniref:WD repeat and HMG-box DNA-binding protein 1-like n=1 Tax=Dermacentor silvarum TaxID=543639 RepID=UPI00189BFBA8|nr:WD repeat and HMG-box DNA-binding protein 1-like [Dermacentor silvarum]